MAELFNNDDDLVTALKKIKKKIVLDDGMNAGKQGNLLSQILYMIKVAEMTDEEYKQNYEYGYCCR